MRDRFCASRELHPEVAGYRAIHSSGVMVRTTALGDVWNGNAFNTAEMSWRCSESSHLDGEVHSRD